MSDRITYDDKELYKESSLPENQKFTYLNANEIKSVVDSHATDIEALQASPPGSGDMNKADYDPANINEQLVGTTAIQSLTVTPLSPSIITRIWLFPMILKPIKNN